MREHADCRRSGSGRSRLRLVLRNGRIAVAISATYEPLCASMRTVDARGPVACAYGWYCRTVGSLSPYQPDTSRYARACGRPTIWVRSLALTAGIAGRSDHFRHISQIRAAMREHADGRRSGSGRWRLRLVLRNGRITVAISARYEPPCASMRTVDDLGPVACAYGWYCRTVGSLSPYQPDTSRHARACGPSTIWVRSLALTAGNPITLSDLRSPRARVKPHQLVRHR